MSSRRGFNRLCALLLSLFFIVFSSAKGTAQRLPKNVVPDNYKLFLEPNIAARTFSGEETIQVRVLQPSSVVTLNSLDLEISEAEVVAGASRQTASVEYDKRSEMVRLQFPQPVPIGTIELHLKFSGKLTEGLRGLYLSRSPRRMYAVTQFEGTYARMMFPCFDEPSFKATFDLSVMTDPGDTAISNGRIVSEVTVGARKKITFSTSPRMSTYLVALAIGDWQCLERTADAVPIRVCAVPEKKDTGKFALEAAARSIEFYNQWYGIRYPFGKLDMVAIPDYEWGGMENTAAIFYRDTALLLDESKGNASVFDKQGHAGTIAHEIAHQWFGDLVTAAWWDDIWLNEGFASWMQRKPVEAWHPEWQLEAGAAASAQQIIALDSLPSARAIHGDPKTSAEIKEMFDGITYEKGAAVLRMLEAYVGPEVFRKGVNQYLKEHANGNATSEDFWRDMAQASGKPVDKIMPTFVMQPGVPLVSLNAAACKGQSMPIAAEQQRFLISSQTNSSGIWQIPMCLKAQQNSNSACYLLSQKQQDIAVNSCPAWYFGNRDAKGYYRVFYADQQNLTKVAEAAEKELNAPERIGLVEDGWAMTRAGKYPIATFMYIAQHMQSERERLVLELLAGHLLQARSLVAESQQQYYQAFLRAQFSPIEGEIGWEPRVGEPEENRAIRATLLAMLGEAGDATAVAAAQKLVQQYLAEPGSTDATMTGAAFQVAATNGDAALYDRITSALGKAKSSQEYRNYLFALAEFRKPDLVQRTLGLIDNGTVRQQDYPGLFAALLANPASRDAAWNYLKTHWTDLQEKVTSFGGRGAVSALGDFCSSQEKQDVQRFFADHRAPGAERALQQSLESMDSCMEFRQLQQANMEKWLAQQH